VLPQAEQAWQRVAATMFDAGDYLLTPSQADDARKLMAMEKVYNYLFFFIFYVTHSTSGATF
jgi:hypothetical protein